MPRAVGQTLRLNATRHGRLDELAATAAIWASALLVTAGLVWLISSVAWHGAGKLSLGFLIEAPRDAGVTGGIGPILVSTLALLAIALLAAVPVGIATAMLLAEFTRQGGRFSRIVRLSLDVLAGVPSIVFGLFGNAFFSITLGLGFSLLSGGLTLACMVLPLFIRASEEGFRAVPEDYRQAAAALGISRASLLSCLNRMTDMVAGCRVRGTIRLGGEDIHAEGVDLIALRRRVGMIFQRPNPFPLSIRANIAYPLRHHGLREPCALEAAVERALSAVGLWTEVKDRLDGPALGLSGGQQQRLCIARALALEPEVMLLDEPCSALDPIASGVVEDFIVSLRPRYTVVIVTHNLAQARRIADDVAILWHIDGAGRLIESGPAAQTFEKPRHEISAMYIAGVRG